MKIIEPTKREIFQQMKLDGCTWCGGHGCECTTKFNMSACFEITKKWLTRTEYTDEEIEEMKAKAEHCEADDAFDEFWDYLNS